MDPISRNDVVRLIALCAVDDQRTVGKEDIDLWFGVARVENWTVPAVQRVIVEHAARGADRPRLKPAAITDRIRAVRSQAAATFELPVIPDGLPNSDYPEWLRARRDAHVDALVHGWATTGEDPPAQLPPGPPPNQIGQRRLAELTAGAFRDVPSAADVTGKPPTADGMQARSAALAVACPYCGARPIEPCTRASASGRVPITRLHPARTDHSSTSEEAS